MTVIAIPDNRASFSVDELVSATGGRLVQRGTAPVCGVCTDSRADLAGKVFVALVGERFNGHGFVDDALRRGAVALILSESPARAVPADVTVILVPSTLGALGELGLAHRLRWGKHVLAIAGSAGKTTTRGVCSALLAALLPGRIHSTVGNFNNRIGVPMTLLGLTAAHEWCVVELGTNQPGELAELARIAVPEAGILTLIALEHTEGLGDLDGVAREEGALLARLPADGVAIGFGEDARVLASVEHSPAARRWTYGLGASRHLRIVERILLAPGRTHLHLTYGARSFRFDSPLAGLPGALAVAAGVLACEALLPGQLTSRLAESALQAVGEPGRARVSALAEGRLLIDDSYNSNPASVRHSIQTAEELARFAGGRLWLVLGEMLELGSLSEVSHREMGRVAAHSAAAALFAVQGEARRAEEEARELGLDSFFFDDAAQVGPALLLRFGPGDVVLVKASRGVHAERVVDHLLSTFGGAQGT